MATLEQVGELVTEQLRQQVERLVEAVEEEAPDFSRVSSLADDLGELSDKVGAIYRRSSRRSPANSSGARARTAKMMTPPARRTGTAPRRRT